MKSLKLVFSIVSQSRPYFFTTNPNIFKKRFNEWKLISMFVVFILGMVNMMGSANLVTFGYSRIAHLRVY